MTGLFNRDVLSLNQILKTGLFEVPLKLSALAENKEGINLLENIYRRIKFIRKINLEDQATRTSFIGAHGLILEAVTKKDGDLAVSLLSAHLNQAIKGIEAHIQLGLAKIFAADIA